MHKRSFNYKPPEKGRGSKLTAKQSAFVDEYFVDFVGSRAVVRAGYNTKNPRRAASELFAHPLIRAEIESRKAEKREKSLIDADYVLDRLQQIVEDTQTENPTAALRGLELLGKHLGLYRDRQEISGPDGNAIEMEQRVREDVSTFTRQLSRLAAERGADPISDVLDTRPNGRTEVELGLLGETKPA